jgi:hypothetical protein
MAMANIITAMPMAMPPMAMRTMGLVPDAVVFSAPPPLRINLCAMRSEVFTGSEVQGVKV